MSTFIETQDLGLSVFGQAQVSYTVDGVKDQVFGQAVALAALQRAVAVESGLSAYQTVLRARQTKLNDLGTALASVLNSLDRVGDKTTSKVGLDAGAIANLRKYGIEVKVNGSNEIERRDIMLLQQKVRYTIDLEDNNCQQDLAMTQSCVNKRDQAYQLASRIQKKADGTRKTGIKYMG